MDPLTCRLPHAWIGFRLLPALRPTSTCPHRQVVADAAPLALRKQQVIEFDATVPCTVQGEDMLLSVMIRNLVDNAIRYSLSGATVKLAVSEVQGVV